MSGVEMLDPDTVGSTEDARFCFSSRSTPQYAISYLLKIPCFPRVEAASFPPRLLTYLDLSARYHEGCLIFRNHHDEWPTINAGPVQLSVNPDTEVLEGV